jgi:tetratricopeptide (TPR) repeat protein
MRMSLPMLLAAALSAAPTAAQQIKPTAATLHVPEGAIAEPVPAPVLAALDLTDVGRPVRAHAAFTKLSSERPDNAWLHLMAANTAPSLAAYLEHLQAAEARAGDATEPVRLRIRIARANLDGDVETALRLAGRLTEVEPDNPRSWLQLAAARSASGDEPAAREAMMEAVKRDPAFMPPHAQLAQSYTLVEPRDLATARQHADHAAQRRPDQAIVHDIVGDVARAENRLEDAARAYSRAAEAGSENGLGYQQRGHVHSFLGRFAEARSDYDAAIAEADPDAGAVYRMYRALVTVHEGKPAEAVGELAKLAKDVDGMDVSDPVAMKLQALNAAVVVALHAELLDPAEGLINEIVRLQAEQAKTIGTDRAMAQAEAQAAYLHGMLAARRGDYEGARGHARAAMEHVADLPNPVRDRPAHEVMGLAALLEGNAEEAVRHYDQTDPNDLHAAFHHAMALEAANRVPEARQLYARIAEDNFNSPGLAAVKAEAKRRAM